jgi:hypothetical protein
VQTLSLNVPMKRAGPLRAARNRIVSVPVFASSSANVPVPSMARPGAGTPTNLTGYFWLTLYAPSAVRTSRASHAAPAVHGVRGPASIR